VDVKTLQGVRLFSSLSKKELEQLASLTTQIDIPAGTELMREGALAHEFFVIEDGLAEVRLAGERIAELGPGDFFGEIALVETGRRTATVTATRPLRVIAMTRQEFSRMQRDMPAVADRIEAAVRARLER
jgi:CRP-like cAMP-binding protein